MAATRLPPRCVAPGDRSGARLARRARWLAEAGAVQAREPDPPFRALHERLPTGECGRLLPTCRRCNNRRGTEQLAEPRSPGWCHSPGTLLEERWLEPGSAEGFRLNDSPVEAVVSRRLLAVGFDTRFGWPGGLFSGF